MAVGVFLGIIFIMINQMLILFAIFAERANNSIINQMPAELIQAQQVMAVFAYFLFIIYSIFGSLLFVFRDDIIGMPGCLQFPLL